MKDQPANTQLNAANNLQQLNYQTPSYHIASQNVNRLNRWKRWIGSNIVAFIVASAVLYGCVMCIFMFYLNLDQMNVPSTLIGSMNQGCIQFFQLEYQGHSLA